MGSKLLRGLLLAWCAAFCAPTLDAHALQAKGKAKKGAAPAPAKKSKTGPTKEKERLDPLPPPRETPPTGGGGDSAAPPSVELRGPTRIDFDDRLIQGQTNKSGAVYLFDRKETGITSMVKRRKSFRTLTVGTVYDR